ncbi:MAG TPA: hypothetical protein ENK85_12780 [Saprospiraceae bacterium]|nr:hypothetical protein [Saprospiraceae bacterium]
MKNTFWVSTPNAYNTNRMIDSTLQILQSKYGLRLDEIFFEDVRIGVYKTAVQLTGERYGVAGTYRAATQDYKYRTKRDAGPYSTNHIIGQHVAGLFQAPSTPIVDNLKVATLNALSAKILQNTDYQVIKDKDPIDLIDLSGQKTISIVGAFKGYIQKLSATDHRLNIIEIRPEAIPPEYRHHYVPSAQAPEILPESDVVIITGSTLVNNSLKDLVAYLPKDGITILVGPSSSFVPDVLFEKGIDIIGATAITHPKKMLQIVSEAATGFHFFRYCAQKICILNKKSTTFAS